MEAVLRDELTGLPTRGLLREHLGVARARLDAGDGGRMALLWIGFDDLRLVNESLGHDAGEAVLRETAQRLRGLGGPVSVVARLDGAEFAVLLADLGGDGDELAQLVAEQLGAALSEPFVIDGRELRLTTSVGISLLPDDAADEDGLLRHAEAAMHDAKGEGGASFSIYAGATRLALDRLMLTTRLHRALEQEELTLHFQPIVALPGGAPEAAEALLRWQDPHHGMVPPMSFIPVAEYTGLIEPIGAWVLRAACAQARAWRDADRELAVFVNVSVRQFQAPDFGAQVLAAIAEQELEPSAIVLEITETTAMSEGGEVDRVLGELRAAGVRVAIDDFGTGYSSFGRLQELPADIIKIDRALLPEDPRPGDVATRLAAATIEVVRALDLRVLVEGVETQAQLEFLIERDCHLAQGFHLGRPAPADAFAPQPGRMGA